MTVCCEIMVQGAEAQLCPLCSELQLKYGKQAESETPSSRAVEEPDSAEPAPHSLQKTGSWIATKLQEQSPSSICESMLQCCLRPAERNILKTLCLLRLHIAFSPLIPHGYQPAFATVHSFASAKPCHSWPEAHCDR